MSFRYCLTRLAVLVSGTGGAAFAFAQDINLQGDASAYFNAGPSTTYGGLSYLGSTFDVNTAGGFYALGGNAGTPNLNNLGSMTLSTQTFDYNNPPATFTLDVTFTAPTGIVGSNMATYTADLIGSVSAGNAGGVHIDFGNAPTQFNFTNSSGTGYFTLNVNPVSIHPGQTVAVSGYGKGQIQAVPEPTSLACIAMGLGGAFLRRRWTK